MFGLRLGKLGAAIKAGTGSAGGVTPLFSRDFALGTLGASPTFARSGAAYYNDYNGDLQSVTTDTAAFEGSGGDSTSTTGYTAIVYGDSLATDSDEYGGNVQDYIPVDWTLTRKGVNAYRLDQIKALFDSEYPQSQDVVILQGGVNDLGQAVSDPNASMQSDMAAMVADVISNGKQPIIVNVAPWRGNGAWTADKQTWTETYNRWLITTYPEYVVDAYHILEDPDNLQYLLPVYDSGDYTHLTVAGSESVDAGIATKLSRSKASLWHASSRTNIVPSDPADAYWTKVQLSYSTGKLSEVVSGSTKAIYNTIAASGQHTLVAKIRPQERCQIILQVDNISALGVRFGLYGAGVALPDTGYTNYGIRALRNGYYIVWITTPSALQAPALYVLSELKGTTAYTGVLGYGVDLEYIELFAATGEQPPVPNATTSTTRAADSLSYSGAWTADNETRAVVDAGNVDVDDWDGVVDATLLGADNSGLVESITVYTTGERPA